MRWVGIDEAGYGPNLGPLVMTAVVAEGPGDREPDVWGDLASTVSRAGGPPDRLWVDDSKKIYQGGQGRDRLDAGCLVALGATGRAVPGTLGGLIGAIGAGTLDDAELSPWLEGPDPRYPDLRYRGLAERLAARRPLDGASWRIVDVRSVVVGPRAFNAGLEATGSKAMVHFSAFARLMAHVRSTIPEGQAVAIRSDKHGGRHFYGGLLAGAFPDAEVVRGPEGPDLSRYDVIGPGLMMTLSLVPRADAVDGLVALASIVSKAVRERWMDAFNAHWIARVPGLRPTAGYPVDAARFREAIEPGCRARGLDPTGWWRAK
jgi:hypothetical protein